MALKAAAAAVLLVTLLAVAAVHVEAQACPPICTDSCQWCLRTNNTCGCCPSNEDCFQGKCVNECRVCTQLAGPPILCPVGAACCPTSHTCVAIQRVCCTKDSCGRLRPTCCPAGQPLAVSVELASFTIDSAREA
eukprot:SM000422S15900  [mRNA]  locus=s422:35286:37113:- [translate_table: standard]